MKLNNTNNEQTIPKKINRTSRQKNTYLIQIQQDNKQKAMQALEITKQQCKPIKYLLK